MLVVKTHPAKRAFFRKIPETRFMAELQLAERRDRRGSMDPAGARQGGAGKLPRLTTRKLTRKLSRQEIPSLALTPPAASPAVAHLPNFNLKSRLAAQNRNKIWQTSPHTARTLHLRARMLSTRQWANQHRQQHQHSRLPDRARGWSSVRHTVNRVWFIRLLTVIIPRRYRELLRCTKRHHRRNLRCIKRHNRCNLRRH